MIYIESLKKYAILLLQTALFFIGALLIYFFLLLVYLKFKGNTDILLKVLSNYGLFVLYTLPLIVMVASFIYFGFLGNDRFFIIRMVPYVAGLNTVLLFLFFLVKVDFMKLEPLSQITFTPDVRAGYVNTVGKYQVYLHNDGTKKPQRGVLFYKNAHFFNEISVKNATIQVNTTRYIGNNSMVNQYAGFSIPRKAPYIQLHDTGVTFFVFQKYMDYLNKLRTVFHATFMEGGPILSFLAILFMGIVFFGIIAGIAGFVSDKQVYIFSISTLFMLAILLLFIFPNYLSMILLIKFGITHPLFKVILPSFFVGLLSSVLAYSLLEFRELMLKRSGNK